MKKALVNQWYVVRMTFFMLLAFCALHVLQLVFEFNSALVSDFTVVGLVFYSLFADGHPQNAKWNNYTGALPISVAERVNASFVFAVLQMFIAFAAIMSTNIVSIYLLDDMRVMDIVWSFVDVKAIPKEILAVSVAVFGAVLLSVLH